MVQYRFWEFKSLNNKIEDYCRAQNLELARAVFKRHYPNYYLGENIREIFMKDYAPTRQQKK